MNTSVSLEQQRIAALEEAGPFFSAVETTAEKNTLKIVNAFRQHRVSDYHFRGTTGYGYNDIGRDTLDLVWATVFCAEKALVRSQFASGTHALSSVLFGILRAGDELLAVTGTPYDTMRTVIGYARSTPGSLKEMGISYREIPMLKTGVDLPAVIDAIGPNTRMVLIQRSRGYSMRKPLSIADIAAVCANVKKKKPDCICFVDNCYGEFVEEQEPTGNGADIIAGSLIKNPGGGIAPSGGYVAGRSDLVDLAAARLTAPGIGSAVGASLVDNRLLYQGLFLAPHVVCQALKSALFAAALFAKLGYATVPALDESRSDIIQAINLGTPEKMLAFCRGLQQYSPVDAYVTPEAGDMPGYDHQIVMAGGTFVQGSSIELSADGPIRPPYTLYLQGGTTFEHARIGIMGAAAALEKL